MRVLVVNAGSSSLKLSVLDDNGHAIAAHDIADWDGDDGPIADFTVQVGPIDAVGHRVVHGGTEFTGPVVVDADVEARLSDLVALAPMHQPAALAALAATRKALPEVTHVACFDTAFHATIPPAAHTYALPSAWRDKWPLRRFGFHGLSHSFAARRAARLCGRAFGELHIVSCHLGAGASLCAIRGGQSVDTTMGFTPLDGLVMATRAGSVDPGLVLWLLKAGGLTVAEVESGLERHSGLEGLADTPDMRAIVARSAAGDDAATLAFDVYTHSLRRELGAMKAALGRVDAIVFTGGVGEHAPAVRTACDLELDAGANAAATGDAEISAAGADVRTFVVTAREDVEIARGVRACLG